MTKTWCVGGRHYSNTSSIIEYEKVNPKTKKLVKIVKSICSICGRFKSEVLLSNTLEQKILLKRKM